MAKKKVFVSFDYDKDRQYYYLLKAWNANPDFDFIFNDYSSGYIKSNNVSVIKACLTKKIMEATYTLVIIGEDINKRNPQSAEIGCINWQNFEIASSIRNRNKLIGVKINHLYKQPIEMQQARTSWAFSFTEDNIIKALKEA